MNRRQHLLSLGVLGAHAMFPSILAEFVRSGRHATAYDPVFFSEEEMGVVIEIIDIILPATKSRSASEVNTHHFLDEVFGTCLEAARQDEIKEGIQGLLKDWNSISDKAAEIARIDQQAFTGGGGWFVPFKQYTLIGFFTSEEGTTVASDYVKIPGDYKGEIEANDSTLNIANTDLRYYL